MKSQRFSFSRILMMFMFAIFTSLILVACGDSDQDLVDAAINTVGITYASGDSQDSVTENLILPESIGEISVSWASGNPDVITNAGVVTRPETDTEVTLTATLTLGDAEATVPITVTVIAAEVVIDPLDALAAIEITGDTVEKVGSVYETTSDIVLPETSMGLAITWQTSNASYVALDGSVTRPAFGVADQVVTLTATIDGEEAQFLVKVLAFTEKPVSQILDEAKVALLLDGISGGTAVDITLPDTVGSEGVTVTWSSSNTDVIANDGMVTRPTKDEGDITVTLTATLTLENQSVEKTFDVLIFALTVDPVAYDSIADVFANATSGDYISLEDVTVIGLTDDTYFFTDGTNVLAVYGATNVEEGKVYNIYGKYDVYYGSPQLNAVADAQLPTVARESDGAVSTMTPTVVDDIDAFVPDTMPTYDASNLFVYEYMTVTAKVRVQGDGNYDTVFVNPDYDGGNINTDANSAYTTNAIMIYYKSNKEAFNQYDGMTVTFDALLYSLRTDRTIFTLVFLGEDDDILFTPSDQEVLDMAINTMESAFDYEYIEETTFDLFTSTEYGATVVWEEVTSTGLVDLTTGELSLPETGQTTVELKATVTVGTLEEVFTVSIEVGELPNSTILEAIQLGTGHLVEVTGVITSAEYQNTYFIQDETGGIAIYTSWGDLETFLQTNIGKEVTIIGERAAYRGLIQLSNIYSYELVNETPTAIVEVNVDEHGLDAASLEPFQGQLVEFTGLIVVDVYEHPEYGNIEITLLDGVTANQIVMKWDSRVDLSTEAQALLDGIAVNDVLDIINPLAWNDAPYLYFTDTTAITEGTLSNEAAVAATKAALTIDFDEPIVADETLTLLDTYLGTTITWASDNTAVITDAGVVTVPADMKQVKVTLTATITLDTITETKTFEILVGDIITILSAQALEDDVELKVQGVVIAAEYDRTYFIQDATGGIAVYTSDETFQATFESNLGKEVIVTGTRDTYSGLRQIAPTAVEALTTGTLPAATNVDAVAIDDEAMLPYQGMLVEFTDLLVVDVYFGSSSSTIDFVRVLTNEEISMRYDADGVLTTEAAAALEAIKIGDVLTVQTVLSWFYGPQMYYTSSTVLTTGALSDEEIVAGDSRNLSQEAGYTEATTITFPTTGDLGSSIAWTSSDAALIDPETGAVTMPAEGQVLVVLTATLTSNAAELEVTFDVYVGTPVPDLFFSEYIEGSSQNKALEIYNPLDVAVDLGDYKVNLYTNGKTTIEQTLTFTAGTMLASGEVYVIYNSQSATEILNVGDVSSSVTYFNGDDAIVLVKIEGANERPIDIFGEVGTDPGSSWTVGDGSTSNHTLVRKETINMPTLFFTPSEWVVYDEDDFTHLGSHTMTVPTAGDTFTETFEIDLGSSYVDGNFTGVNGIVWSYVEARNVDTYAIDGTGVMLRRSDEPSSLSATFANGLMEISFEYRKAFTGSAERLYSVDITNNGVTQTFVIESFGAGSGAQETVYTFSLDNLNLVGETVVEIYATGSGQASFDNFTWTDIAE
jgi:predicted extracellular nuclease